MKYRLFAAFIAFLMVLSLVSCGGAYHNNSGNDPSTDLPKEPTSADIQTPPIESKECQLTVQLAQTWSGDWHDRGILAVFRSLQEVDTFVNENKDRFELSAFQLICDDYGEGYFEESTLLVYYAVGSSCCFSDILKGEMMYDPKGDIGLDLYIDNISNHDIHTEDVIEGFYVIEIATTEIEGIDDVNIVYTDGERSSMVNFVYDNKIGQPIAFESMESLSDFIRAYDYKQFDMEYRRSYQAMMRSFLDHSYLYSVTSEGAEKGSDGIEVFPQNLSRGVGDDGYRYGFEKDGTTYLVTVYNLMPWGSFDEEDTIYEYCFNKFGYMLRDCAKSEIQSDSLQTIYRYNPYNTQTVFYRALIDRSYYVDVRTVDAADTENIAQFIQSLSFKKIYLEDYVIEAENVKPDEVTVKYVDAEPEIVYPTI